MRNLIKAMKMPIMRNAPIVPATIPPTAPGEIPFVLASIVEVAVVVAPLGIIVVVLWQLEFKVENPIQDLLFLGLEQQRC